MKLRWLLSVVLAFAGVVPAAGVAVAAEVAVPPPVMGWASWNTFAAKIDYSVIKAQADALVSSGLKDAGYSYVNIDEGWWQGTRDSAGNITVDTAEWPGGMSAIADYLHSKGLKAGIYTDAGRDGCGYYYPTGRPAAPGSGSEGHYLQDMLQFQRWGFDFVKVDWCGGDAEGLDPASTYRAISDANRAATAQTGRTLALSICDWGKKNPWNWGPGTAPMWRTSTDIIYYGQTATLPQALTNFDQAQHPVSQHTGYVNDPDMLTVGMPGLSAAQGRTEFGMWAVSGAPLLAGNNLATMSAETANILKNREVIAVDQDSRGLQGVKVAEDAAGLQVYGKVLSGTGKRAVLLLNRTSSAATMTARWADLGLTPAAARVRNLWAAADEGSYSTGYSVSVPAGDSVLLTVEGTDAAAAHGTTVTAAATGLAVATFTYSATAAQTATLAVNGQQPTALAFPATGGAAKSVSAVVSLGKGTNTLKLTGTPPPVTDVAVLPLPGTDGVQVVGTQSGRCLDVNDNSIANGVQAQLWDCAAGPNQTWAPVRGQLVVNGTKCLDAYNNGTANGTAVVIWDCNGQRNQQWTLNANGTVTNALSGLCLDASGAATANGTKIILWACGGGANQQWTRR
ncbi:RICIN domain-containing protein [Amycolatopsis sp. SID8362]|uniref:RICIN domain-containing protein n=1 Tax=Amycolatopsis sp. SID8362 TaxID=2690346 RepID=UPI00136BE489|nr:RICIN domain-containing protein [Amycolatopsis sp. SID8362]NBH05201.1 alpha-galactosidase [Amycolatopsis sp. SID8362]NED41901.1 alpha-galactosidase [Amycolatopsis sp. SID8362]